MIVDVFEAVMELIELVDFLLSPVRWARRIRLFAANRRLRRMEAARLTHLRGDPLPLPGTGHHRRSIHRDTRLAMRLIRGPYGG